MTNRHNEMKKTLEKLNELMVQNSFDDNTFKNGVYNPEALEGQAMVNKIASFMFSMDADIEELKEAIKGLKKAES